MLFDIKSDFQAHFMPDRTLLISLHFDPSNDKHLAVLDNFTSTAIRHGGTLNSGSRSSLDAISPYLAKRIVGQNSVGLQEQMKLLFDPNDVMVSNRMFWVKENQGKSWLTKLRE